MSLLDLTMHSELLAYVGPGPALSMTWALLGLFATLATAVFALFAWPIRRMVRRFRKPSA